MADLIDRQAILKHIENLRQAVQTMDDIHRALLVIIGMDLCEEVVRNQPSAQPEKTVYIPETKAIPTARSCVDLAEKVTATYYDEEHEEWTQRTVTIADVLDSVCDDYTILPSVQPELRWIPVEEKLPEVGESVLVTFSLIEKYSCVKIARYGTPIHDEYNICFYESDNEWGDCEISGVTAWMPLPKPYERRTDE